MANIINLAEKFVAILDGIYKKASLTSVLDANTKPDFSGVNTVKVMKVTTTGLGDYSKEKGYAKGNATLEWEAMTLNEDRAAELTVDRMDDEETLGQAFGMIMNDFMQRNVAPEIDAYRFSKYAKTSDIGSVSGALADGAAVIAALRAATTAMDEAEVPNEDRILYITPTLLGLVQDLDTTKSKEVFKRFSAVVEVPQTRFYTDITMNSGADAWGYTKGAGAKDINFLAVAKSAVVQATKMALPKVFDPDTNQTKDAWLFSRAPRCSCTRR
jgi:hypothetical protein